MEENKKSNYGNVYLSWKFPDRVNYQRGIWWYIIFLLIVVPVLIFSIIKANFLFVLIVVLFSVIILILNRRPKMEIEALITETGIAVGNKFYLYSDIKKFYIIYDPPAVKKLYLEFKVFRPYIGISIEDINPLNLREILLEYLKEDKNRTEEPPMELLERILKI